MRILLCRSKSSASKSERGIALITTLLLMILLSALAVAFVMAVNTENRLQGGDKGNTKAYYGAEGAMEKMMADLNTLYTQQAAPSVNDITSLGCPPPISTCPTPSISGISYSEYLYNVFADPNNRALPLQYESNIQSGPNQGLIASVVPIGLSVTADTTTNEEVRMTRQVEVALIPVFQFGVFSDSDLSFFAGPNFSVSGRVQTNGDLYLAAHDLPTTPGPGGITTFLDKIRTAKEVVRDTLANGLDASGNNYNGIILIPNTNGGCSGPVFVQTGSTNCLVLSMTSNKVNDGSWLTGINTTATWPDITDPYGNTTGGQQNPGWSGIHTKYADFLDSHKDAIQPLKLPFVGNGVSSIEILRRPAAGDNTITKDSRLYNKAQIRVLLEDDPNLLPGGSADSQNVQLSNIGFAASGVPPLAGSSPACTAAAAGACNVYFAEGTTSTLPTTPTASPDSNWSAAGAPKIDTTLSPAVNPNITTPANSWNLLGGWLRVEVKTNPTSTTYTAVTQEWLQLGFARGYTPPTTPSSGANPNPIHPNAILIFQELANRGGVVKPGPATFAPTTELVKGNTASTGVGTPAYYAYGPAARNNYYPINLYDTREGEPRELEASYGCTVNGVTNVTEIDVANLQRWLHGDIGTTGNNFVESTSQNGYILYFSDHRGMQNDVNGNKRGAYGFEDVINPTDNVGIPNGNKDGGEDVEQPGDVGAGLLEVVGANNLGLGFGFNPNDLSDQSVNYPSSAFTRLKTCNIGRANWVSGARHAVRLIDGGAGNLPLRKVNLSTDPNNTEGFTLASDNPAYILGDYNLDQASYNGMIASPPVGYTHASAAVLADTVTLLSNAWNDYESFISPGNVGNTVTNPPNNPNTIPGSAGSKGRSSSNTYYRVAIASGKGVNFRRPGYTGAKTPIGTLGAVTNGPAPTDGQQGVTVGVPADFGTDGGVHNFLRYLENWSGTTSTYVGSMVSLYYAQYDTGTFKCCGMVYSPPTRNYNFDLDFQHISTIPPGTPRFQEVVNVGYKQDLSYR